MPRHQLFSSKASITSSFTVRSQHHIITLFILHANERCLRGLNPSGEWVAAPLIRIDPRGALPHWSPSSLTLCAWPLGLDLPGLFHQDDPPTKLGIREKLTKNSPGQVPQLDKDKYMMPEGVYEVAVSLRA